MLEMNAGMRHTILRLDPKGANLDLQSMGDDYLRRLIDQLPSDKASTLTSPFLKRLRTKAKTALAALRTPHLDPESWPQIYRMQMRLNNSRAGLKDFSGGQIGHLHPKGLSMQSPLRGNSTWTTADAGNLHIMGPWSEITSLLGSSGARFMVKMGDMYDGDVNIEFDRMYGAPKGESEKWYEKISAMPLYVTLTNGAMFSKADTEGEVLLNAPGQIVKAVGDKVAGIAIGAGPASLGNDVLDGFAQARGHWARVGAPSYQLAHEFYDMRKEAKLNKTLATLTVGIAPVGKNYAVGTEDMSAFDVLTLARRLR